MRRKDYIVEFYDRIVRIRRLLLEHVEAGSAMRALLGFINR